jgi:CGNR zinc finger
VAKRSKYQDTPEHLLRRVISELEQGDEPGHPSHQRAIRALLTEGPLIVPASIHKDRDFPDRLTASAWRAELVAFLRSIVRKVEGRRAVKQFRDGFGLPTDEYPFPMAHLATRGRLNYGVHVTMQGDIRRIVESTVDAKDVVIEQFLRLLEFVGVRGNVRSCEASDCQHIFVRTYRQRFCSQTCQDRTNKRKHRRQAAERAELEQQARARRRHVSTKGR